MTETRALWARESLAASRLARTPWLLGLSSLAMASAVLLAAAASHDPSYEVGRNQFHVAYALAISFVTLFGPAIAANAIALEREGKTWEALVMAGVSTRAIDRGKFLGAYTHLVLYVLALVPALGIPHLFGGVQVTESVLALVMLLAIGALTVRFGLMASAIVPTARTALLVTVLASAMLAGFLSMIGLAATDLLDGEVGMHSLAGEGPIFWPVALVHERVSFDWVRYLVIVPIGAVVVAWSAMRAATLAALEAAVSLPPSAAALRSRARKRHLLLLTMAVLLGLLPGREKTLFAAEATFATCAVAIIVAVAGAPSRGPTVRRSIGLVVGATAGIFVVLAVARLTAWARGAEVEYASESLESAIWMLLLYVPAFSVFATGATALARARIRSGSLARFVAAAAVVAGVVVPLVVAVFTKAATGTSAAFVAVLSPVGVVSAHDEPEAVVAASIAWALLGAFLLFATDRRERRVSP